MLEFSEIVRNLGLVIGAAIALMIAAWRSHAANRQADAALAQSALAQRGHVTETFNRAIDQLRDEKLEVRLGAIYTLRMIFSQRPLTEYRQPIVEILTAYGRERTSQSDVETPSQDIEEIMNFLRLSVTDDEIGVDNEA